MATPPVRPSLAELLAKAKVVRKHIIECTTAANSGHPTSSLSGVEVVVALYFAGIMRYDAKNPTWPNRDKFILSKGHAAPLLYSVMAEAGYFSTDLLATLRQIGSVLEGHPNYRRLPGIEASTGSLGQGLSIGVGAALAAKLDNTGGRVFVMTGDGELAEGQIWEAVMSAHKFKLDNLVCIVDQNGYQQTGATTEVLDLRPVVEKFAAFGWHTDEINGNDMAEVLAALDKTKTVTGKPCVIVSRTVKGFPITSLLGNDPNHHGKPLTKDEAAQAIAMIGV